jgi:hypothetical protein
METILHTEPGVFQLSHSNNILTLKIFENKFDDITSQTLINNIDTFHKICENNNKKFYSLVDLTECSLLNLPNYLYYAPMFTKYLNTQNHFLDKHLYGTLYIINNNTVKTILNNIISNYNGSTPINFILKNEDIDFSFTT